MCRGTFVLTYHTGKFVPIEILIPDFLMVDAPKPKDGKS